MTKSTITREQRINEVKELIANAEEWAGYYEHPIHDKPQREMFEGMARVMAEHLAALTAMDSDPLAVTDDELNAALQLHRLTVDGHSQLSDAFRAGFRYARRTTPQPAPVVSAELLHTAASAIEDLLTTKDRTGACVWFDLPFRLRSAANAQPAPVVPKEMTAGIAVKHWEGGRGSIESFIAGYNFCRAAILAAAPQEVKGE